MKEYYHHPRSHRRPLASLRLLLAAGATLLAACTADDALTGDAATTSGTPVAFTAAVESVALPATSSAAAPHTRTAIGDNGETTWTAGDAVGIFMLTAGGTTPADILPDAANVKHTVTPATGALTSAATPLYYPQQGTVDFIAYYPYAAAGAGSLTNDYAYRLSLADQSTPAAIDLLRATAAGREKSPTAVSLPFAHVLSKIVLDITLGDGLATLPADKITAATLTGMPASATLSLMEGTLTPGTAASLAARQETAPTGVTATFTALVPPHAAQDATPAYPDRSIVVTVDGVPYTAAIPAAHTYAPNTMYVYPVTVQKSGIILGSPDITAWTTADHGSNDALYVYTLTYDGNGATAGTVPAAQAIDGSTVTLPDATALTPPAGKAFAGWSTTPDASADFHRPGSPFTPTRHTTLYALWSGDGSSEATPILIYDQQGMASINDDLTKHYRLMRDITLDDWRPLASKGNPWEPNPPFTGTFHGGGHTLTINSISSELAYYVGIFGKAGPCYIRQLCVAGKIEFNDNSIYICGGIVGQAADGCIIENCLVTADITVYGNGAMPLGGILGQGPTAGGSGSIVKNCLMLGNLNNTAPSEVGGIVGNGENSAIVNCVVLSPEITGKPNRNKNNEPYRIGLSDVLTNNYANRDMTPGVEWPGHQWTSKLDGDDGAHCDATPAESWWKTTGNWKTDGEYTAWDFTNIWEFGSDGYPRLRIIQ